MSDERGMVRRRRLLQASVPMFGVLAGCSGDGSDEEARTTTAASDDSSDGDGSSNGDDSSDGDERRPSIVELSASPTPTEGTVEYRLRATGADAVTEVVVSSPVETVEPSVDAGSEVEASGEIAAPPGETIEVSASVTDDAGRSNTRRTTTYVRAFSTPATDVRLGATYLPRVGGWDDCADGEPTGGRYGQVAPDRVTTHADQLLGHGATRVRVPLDPGSDARSTLELVCTGPVATEFDVQVYYRLGYGLREGTYRTDLVEIASAAEEFDSVTGVVLGGFYNLRDPDRGASLRDALEAEHGSVSGFVPWLREQFPDVRLVGEVTMPGYGELYNHQYADAYRHTARELDALTNLVWPPESNDDRWATLRDALVETYRGTFEFCARHDLEFEPTVAPGLPGGVDPCSDDAERAVPRDLDEYERVLRWAALYATDGRVTVDSFNDWRRGTQLEPGSHDGSDYDEQYLLATRRVATGPPPHPDRDTYYVAPDGDDLAVGSEDRPLATATEGLHRATPGQTVHLLPGEYFQDVRTLRAGEDGSPIEITGPEDAVVRGGGATRVCNVRHGHVHLTGCSFDGLYRPERPDDWHSYRERLIWVWPLDWNYMADVKILPHAVGNSAFDFVNCTMTNRVEIGEFRVTGLAGANYVLGDRQDHQGEIVYVGTPRVPMAEQLNERGTLDGADTSHDYHVHHIDNSAGHPHSELVDVKSGAHDVTVEYCTDGGGSQANDEGITCSISFAGHDNVARWNDLRDGRGHGVKIDADPSGVCQQTTPEGHQGCVGYGNSIYGNRITGFEGKAVLFEAYLKQSWGQDVPANVFPEDQEHICGNDVTGPTDADPEQSCPSSVSEGDGIGHLGGDSPWK